LTLKDTLKIIDPETKPLLAELLVSKATITLCDVNVKSSGASQSPSLEAKELAKTALALLCVKSQEVPHALLVKARALSILGQTYSCKAASSSKARLDLALDYFCRSLAILRFITEMEPSIQHFTLIAELCLHIGRVHSETRMLQKAKFSLWEALHIFRYLHASCANATFNVGRHESDLITLGMITTLASIGWAHVLENRLDLAEESTTEHRDIAVSMEAIGSAYQQLAEWSKARSFLEGALQIRKVWRDHLAVARIRSRLALVLLELNDVDRAVQTLSKASITCTKLGIRMDEIGRETRRRLSILREKRLNS